jgi:hypothetical protein
MEMATGRRRWRWHRVALVGLGAAVLVGVYATGLGLYLSAQQSPAEYVKDPKVNGDELSALVKTASIDPNRGDLVLRIEVLVGKNLRGADGISVTQPVRVDAVGGTGTGTASYRYAAGDRISPVDITIGLGGDTNAYPFDTYHAPFAVIVTTSPPGGNPTGAAAANPVTRLEFDGTLSGFRVTSKPRHEQVAEPDVLALDLTIRRTPATDAFAILILVLQVLLASAAAALAVLVWSRHRRVEVTMLTWLAAMLFAIVPLRNAMPGSPPIGALVDVVVFFWAVTVIALSLVSVLVRWSRQEPARQ